ncbi:hypothetical protein BRC89_03695 [Halobacteriales archaeon QS_4_70_19]|nr:MAG: hypothetical protein BRC89_03695 [Halobacteriales archaeon QS_4_70_19]
MVRYLLSRPGETVSADEVVEAVETAEGLLEERVERSERVAVDLERIRVPSLDGVGVLEYNADVEQVRHVPSARTGLLLRCIEGL